MFGGVLDEPGESVHAGGEDIEIVKNFTYLGSVVQNDVGSSQEVTRQIGLAHGVFGVVDTCADVPRFGPSSRL